MVRPRLILVLGDQLSPALAGLRAGDPARDLVVMAEVAGEAANLPHHPKKIAFTFAAMRKFAASLAAAGWRVGYGRLDDPENRQTVGGELLRRAAATGAGEVIVTRPGDWRLIAAIEALPLAVTILEDDRFLCSEAAFAAWAGNRRQLRMEHFYREMRRRTGILMDGDAPAGGRWNFDAENRRPARADLLRPGPLRHAPDAVTAAVLDLVEARFGHHFGRLRPFWFATDRAGAEASRDHFLRHQLPAFGPEQDAMLAGDRFLSHSVLALYLNAGLLDPLDLCRRAEAEWRAGRAPLESVEGFVRQILGWREYVRGIWFREGPDYAARNRLGHSRPLPAAYWGGPTRMACLAEAVAATRDEAYAHHIQRLMVTGLFALLAGVDPAEVHRWYLAVYADAHEWVEAPNVIGMSQFADGGLLASKPYAASGAYIDRMSDYCKGCGYSVAEKSGEGSCPFNSLYWHFLHRHRALLQRNPRMAQMFRTWDRISEDRRAAILATAEARLAALDRGEPV